MLLRRPYWYLRHGETDWNSVNRTQGTTDVPLNATGIAQAHAAAALLAGRNIGAIFCSPLSRARDTAGIIADTLGVAVTIRNDLREANFGQHEGEVMGDWFAAWVEGRVSPDGGESFAQVEARAIAAINDVLAFDGLPLVVGHGAFFRTVRAAMSFAPSVRTPNGVPVHCVPDGDAWRMDAAI